MDKHYLQPLLEPEVIVVFAARHGDPKQQTAQGRALTEAIRAQRFTGTIRFLDIGFTGTLAELSQTRADLAIIALPPADIAAALEVAGRMTCRAALIVSNGVTAEQAAELRKIAQPRGRAAAGPEQPRASSARRLNLNASAAGPLARAGSLGVVCQSGALTAAMLDWARSNGVGFSLMASIGPHTDVDIAQVLDYLANDAQTQSIIVYLEGIGSARRFMSALRSAAIAKPVVVLKAGPQAGRQRGRADAQRGHRSARDEVFDAALRRAGAVRVRSFVELFSAAKCLASRYRPVGPRLALVTNGGGPGRAGRRLGQRDRAEAGQAVGGVHRGAEAAAAGRGVDLRPDRRLGGRRRPSTTPRRSARRRPTRTSTASSRSIRPRPASTRWPSPGGGGAAAHHLQAAALVLDGRRHDGRGARAAQRRRHRELPHARGRGGRVRQHHHVLPEPAPAAADAAAAVHAGQARHRRARSC